MARLPCRRHLGRGVVPTFVGGAFDIALQKHKTLAFFPISFQRQNGLMAYLLMFFDGNSERCESLGGVSVVCRG